MGPASLTKVWELPGLAASVAEQAESPKNFPSTAYQTSSDVPPSLSRHQAEEPIERESAALETRLHYMVKFLEEGGCPNSSGKTVPEPERQEVLQKVRSALAWKSSQRTTEELQSKSVELDTFMTTIIESVRASKVT